MIDSRGKSPSRGADSVIDEPIRFGTYRHVQLVVSRPQFHRDSCLVVPSGGLECKQDNGNPDYPLGVKGSFPIIIRSLSLAQIPDYYSSQIVGIMYVFFAICWRLAAERGCPQLIQELTHCHNSTPSKDYTSIRIKSSLKQF